MRLSSSTTDPTADTLSSDYRRLVIAVLAATVLVLAAFWPGYMTVDANDQLYQARSGDIRDLQPPAMVRVWGVIDAVWPGPAGMVVLNNLLFWAGLLLVVQRAVSSPRTRTLVTILIGLYPPVFALLGTVWKDVAMGAALTFALGLVLHPARTRIGRLVHVTALVLVVLYACAVRHNGIAAVAPLVVALVYGHVPGRVVRLVPLAVAAVVAVFVLAAGLNAAARTGPHQYASQLILLHDLVGMSIEARATLLPEHLRRYPWSLEDLAANYTPEGAQRLFTGIRMLPVTERPSEYAAIVAAWRHALWEHKRAYLTHRWNVFHALLFGRADGSACYPFATGVKWDPRLRIAYEPTTINEMVMPVLGALANTLFFRPWLHVLLALVLLVVAVRSGRALAGAVAVSGLIYVAVYFFVGTTCDFRLAWWLVLVVPLTALLLAGADRVESRRDVPGQSTGGRNQWA